MESPELAEQLGRAARVTATRFSVEQYVEILSSLYRELAWGVAAQTGGTAPAASDAQGAASLLEVTTQE